MKPENALNILVQAAHAGQKVGAFNLAEAKLIAEAIEVFTPKAQPQQEAKPEGQPPTPFKPQNIVKKKK